MNNLWQKFADFLHTANLIPLVVVISTYHYYQVLNSHDPFWVSLPIAQFIDLLPYRTVQRVVQSGGAPWKLAAVFTTLIAFGLQWMFYSKPVDGDILDWWQVILFASIIPVGLAIMAWHQQQQNNELVTDWQGLIARAQEDASDKEQEAEKMRAQVVEMQAEAEKVQQQNAEVQAELTTMQTAYAPLQLQLEQVQHETNRLQNQINVLRPLDKAWQTLNQEAQTLAYFNARLLTAQTVAEQLGIHVTTVRRKAKQINGSEGSY